MHQEIFYSKVQLGKKKIKKNKNSVKKIIEDTVPLKRFGSRDDIAELVNYYPKSGEIIQIDKNLNIINSFEIK